MVVITLRVKESSGGSFDFSMGSYMGSHFSRDPSLDFLKGNSRRPAKDDQFSIERTEMFLDQYEVSYFIIVKFAP